MCVCVNIILYYDFPAHISRQTKNNTDKNNLAFGTTPVNYFYIFVLHKHMVHIKD